MKKYKLINTVSNYEIGIFDTKIEAAEALKEAINDGNQDIEPEDEEWLTPFDFHLEEVEVIQDITEIAVDYNTAREYLGGKPNKQFKVALRFTPGNIVPGLEEVTRLVDSLNPNHVEALIALNELFTIAQAWNKADGFVPDYSNHRQDKWFPWFVYDAENAGFVCADTFTAPLYTTAYFGSRFCFKTANRARQFGNRFIDLWNKVLLF